MERLRSTDTRTWAFGRKMDEKGVRVAWARPSTIETGQEDSQKPRKLYGKGLELA